MNAEREMEKERKEIDLEMANERKEKEELELHDTSRDRHLQRNALVLPPTQPFNPRLGKKAVKGPILLYVSCP